MEEKRNSDLYGNENTPGPVKEEPQPYPLPKDVEKYLSGNSVPESFRRPVYSYEEMVERVYELRAYKKKLSTAPPKGDKKTRRNKSKAAKKARKISRK